jgi:hypothetical protein
MMLVEGVVNVNAPTMLVVALALAAAHAGDGN